MTPIKLLCCVYLFSLSGVCPWITFCWFPLEFWFPWILFLVNGTFCCVSLNTFCFGEFSLVRPISLTCICLHIISLFRSNKPILFHLKVEPFFTCQKGLLYFQYFSIYKLIFSVTSINNVFHTVNKYFHSVITYHMR